jgi:hypothetical protein
MLDAKNANAKQYAGYAATRYHRTGNAGVARFLQDLKRFMENPETLLEGAGA